MSDGYICTFCDFQEPKSGVRNGKYLGGGIYKCSSCLGLALAPLKPLGDVAYEAWRAVQGNYTEAAWASIADAVAAEERERIARIWENDTPCSLSEIPDWFRRGAGPRLPPMPKPKDS